VGEEKQQKLEWTGESESRNRYMSKRGRSKSQDPDEGTQELQKEIKWS
jgi:hypothetical protein